MFTKTVSAAVAFAALASAQTFTSCNPLEKTCPADEAFGNDKISCDMSKDLCGVFTELEGTTLEHNSKGAVFSIEKETNAPTIRSGKYIFFGRVDFEIQATNGQGVVTSAVLQSDDLDEIDWEWVGGDDAQVQTNYFSKGDTTTYDRGAYHDVSNPLTSFHTYSIEWTAESVIWLIDDAPVRTLTKADAEKNSGFPQTPMEIKLGTWVAGRKDAPEGTVEWAGGYTDFSQAPFLAYYKSVSIVDYAGKSGPSSSSIKEYIYGDKTGTWESIKVVKGDGSDDDTSSTTSKAKPTTTSHKATSTKAASTTSEAESTTTSEAESTTSSKATKTSKTSVSSETSAFTTSTSAAASTTTDASETSSTTTPAPAETTTDVPDAAPRSIATLGGAALAAAFVMFAML